MMKINIFNFPKDMRYNARVVFPFVGGFHLVDFYKTP